MKTAELLNIFVETMIVISKILWWIDSSKQQLLFNTEIFWSIINGTFDMFNAYFLNKIYFFKTNKEIILLSPNF